MSTDPLTPAERASLAALGLLPDVEALARSAFQAFWGADPGWSYDEGSDDGREDFRNIALAVLAALGLSPDTPSVDRLVAEVERRGWTVSLGSPSPKAGVWFATVYLKGFAIYGHGSGEHPEPAAALARALLAAIAAEEDKRGDVHPS